jgi:predicted TPR repeat methyltransferase
VPDDFRAHCNLGCLLEAQGKLVEAQKCQMRALDIKPDEYMPHYNLGHVLQRQGRLEAAAGAYRRALELAPNFTAAHFNLGQVLYEQGQSEEALTSFRCATESGPDSFEAHAALGGTLFGLQRIDEAVVAYQRALELNPAADEEQYLLGRMLEALGRFPEAESAYRKTLELNPVAVVAMEALATILHKTGRREEAVEVLEQWLQGMPGEPRAGHLLAALTGESVPERANDSYVAAVFDQFSADFDETLERLNYQAPQLVQQVLAREYPQADGSLDLLDAGCGTGLCGPLLSPYAKRLVGVDLSKGMLAKARERSDYDELVDAELTGYLNRCAADFDVIIAADTLNYFGELAPVFAGARQALRVGGRIIFTLEHSQADGDGYTLNPHGRYSHTESYLSETLVAAGFSITSMAGGALRTEEGRPVMGLVIAATRELD